MRILLLTYFHPPDAAVGGLRAQRIAELLRTEGHDVHVLAAADRAGADPAGSGVERVRVFPNPREWWQRRRTAAPAVPSESAAVGATHSEGYAIPRRIAWWKRALLSALWLPDDRQGFIPPAVRRALRIIRTEGIQLVYSTAPPFSVHVAGLLIKRLSGVPWFAEFRDPWMDGEQKPWHVRTRASDGIERWLERRCLANADQVIAVTDATGAALTRKLRLVKRPAAETLVIRNGIGALEPLPAPRRNRPFRITYLGDLYLRRDPRPFLGALALLRNEGAFPAEGLRVDFFGSCRYYHDVSVVDTARALGLEDVIHIHDRVPHSETAAILADSDLLLLFAQGQPAQVPNKLYEYLGARRPMLAFVDAEGESAAMLRRAGGQFLVTSHDAAEVAATLRSALSAEDRLTVADESVLREWLVDRQFARLANRVAGLAAEQDGTATPGGQPHDARKASVAGP